MPVGTGVLSREQKQNFERDGYLQFDPEISGQVLDGILADLESKYRFEPGQPEWEKGVEYTPGATPRIKDAWRLSSNVKAVALAPKVLSAIQELYGRQPIPFQTLNFVLGTQQAIHADSMHFRPAEPTYMCGFWLALEDIDMTNGPLVYYPGSHRLPFVDYENVGFAGVKDDYPTYMHFIWDRNAHYEQYVKGLLEQHDLTPEYGTIKKGQALIWASNLLHGGLHQEDKSRTRNSQVTHYLFEGSFAYHTPMRTEGEDEFWTTPDPIE
jgi:ectoine hydroxylase-related dioxygenase (phytanoyl-CoA dioxygenase family)